MEKKRVHSQPFLATDAYTKHKMLINDYLRYYRGSLDHFRRSSANDKTDYDIIQENHRFIWEEEDEQGTSWGKSLAKKYYDKLFKEYCISDLSRFKENKYAMRWRTEKEVIEGKGQFICGGRKCDAKEGLQSWEVNFGYVEHGVKKNALVKLRLCVNCSEKLNYHQRRKLVEKKSKSKKEMDRKRSKKRKNKDHGERKKRKRKENDNSTNESSEESDESDEKDEKSETNSRNPDGEISSKAIWSQPAEKMVEKSREEELDDYLEDLFF